MAVALIGGTGVYNPEMLDDRREKTVSTPYGDVKVVTGTWRNMDVAFMPRHGADHDVAPHRINYRANIWGLKELGVTRIVATAAVGSLNTAMLPGHFVFIDQFIDFTRAGVTTFYEGGRDGVVHTDVTEPYCASLRNALVAVADKEGVTYHNKGTYLTVDGPRYETAAEIRMFRQWGADVIGMTNAPEAILSREAGLCYAAVGMVTNMAAGIAPTPLSHDEVSGIMRDHLATVRHLCMEALALTGEGQGCTCGAATGSSG